MEPSGSGRVTLVGDRPTPARHRSCITSSHRPSQAVMLRGIAARDLPVDCGSAPRSSRPAVGPNAPGVLQMSETETRFRGRRNTATPGFLDSRSGFSYSCMPDTPACRRNHVPNRRSRRKDHRAASVFVYRMMFAGASFLVFQPLLKSTPHQFTRRRAGLL